MREPVNLTILCWVLDQEFILAWFILHTLVEKKMSADMETCREGKTLKQDSKVWPKGQEMGILACELIL